MLEANSKCDIEEIGTNTIKGIKEKVYARIIGYLQFEGYPSEASLDFKEANINDLVLYIIGPVLSDFKSETGRNILLRREKELISPDAQTGGYEEFVVVDKISVMKQWFILIIEAKRSSLGEAIRQCLLTMRDMWNNSGRGQVYGFVTTGEVWGIVRYDGVNFQMSNRFAVLFGTMGREKDRWMAEGAIIVDSIITVLRTAGAL